MSPGNMIPQYELIQPYALDMMYQGITSISVGIISVARIITKMNPRPGNCSFAST